MEAPTNWPAIGFGTDVMLIALNELRAAWKVEPGESSSAARWRLHALAWSLNRGAGPQFLDLGVEGSGGYLLDYDDILQRAGASLRLAEAAFRGPPPGIELPASGGEPCTEVPVIGYLTAREARDAAQKILALDDIATNTLYSPLYHCAVDDLTMLFVSSSFTSADDELYWRNNV